MRHSRYEPSQILLSDDQLIALTTLENNRVNQSEAVNIFQIFKEHGVETKPDYIAKVDELK